MRTASRHRTRMLAVSIVLLLWAPGLHAEVPPAGGGLFRETARIPLGHAPLALAVGDLDGDGFPDVALAEDGDSVVSTLLGDGAGGLHARRDLLVGPGLFGIALADVDLDGRLDAVVSGSSSGAVY